MGAGRPSCTATVAWWQATLLHRFLQGCDKPGQRSWGPTSSGAVRAPGEQEAESECGAGREGKRDLRTAHNCGGAGAWAGGELQARPLHRGGSDGEGQSLRCARFFL